MRQINLFVDAHVFDGEFQGSRTFIKEIYNLVCNKPGIQLYIAAHTAETLRANFPAQKNITFISYKSTSRIKRLLFEIPQIIRHYKIDYAHFQYIIAPIKRCKYIVTLHDVIFKEFPQEFSVLYRIKNTLLFKYSVFRSDIITTVSNYSKQSISRYLAPGAKKILITGNGVNDIFFEPYVKLNSQAFIKNKYKIGRYILYVSRFEPRKNHRLLLESFINLKLHEKGYHLVLLGHTSIPVPGFYSLLKKLPPETRKFIFIANHVNDTELLEFYRGCELFVYPSKAEGFGIPPLEAGALKIPVICSNTSAMKEFDFFGEYHLTIQNELSLREKIQAILTSPPNTTELDFISSQIRNRYSWSSAADTLYTAITENFTEESSKNH